MKDKLIILICISLVFVWGVNAFAAVKEEREERTTEEARIMRKPPPPSYKLSSRVATFVGYDNNARLTSERKGDIFEELLYSLNFIKPFPEGFKFRFDYDLDVMNFNQFTELSTILNHFRLGMYKKISTFEFGSGYDLGIIHYYHNSGDDFLFHKGFFSITHDLMRNMYQKIEVVYGVKDYDDQKALADTIGTYQDKERLDKRWTAAYSIGAKVGSKLFLRVKSKFTLNDSNARYIDFYDYKSYGHSLSINYNLLKQLYLLSRLSYTRKLYDSRTVTLRDYKQKDNLYAGTMGFLYKINKNNSVSVYYTYRENSSNDSLEDYSESVISCGWQYNF